MLCEVFRHIPFCLALLRLRRLLLVGVRAVRRIQPTPSYCLRTSPAVTTRCRTRARSRQHTNCDVLFRTSQAANAGGRACCDKYTAVAVVVLLAALNHKRFVLVAVRFVRSAKRRPWPCCRKSPTTNARGRASCDKYAGDAFGLAFFSRRRQMLVGVRLVK